MNYHVPSGGSDRADKGDRTNKVDKVAKKSAKKIPSTIRTSKLHGPRVAFQTLGCKLNQYETDSLAARFEKAGYRIVPFGQKAEVYIVNTCTVTNKADRKSRNTIHRALRAARKDAVPSGSFDSREGPASLIDLRGNRNAERSIASASGQSVAVESGRGGQTYSEEVLGEDALVVVTGCFAKAAKVDFESEDRTILVENDKKPHIFDLVDGRLRGEILGPEDLPSDLFGYTPQSQLFHTRGMLKIQDGCDNFCTFCIIPFVRGGATSRPLPDILGEAHNLLAQGYKELVLTGVNMSRYLWEGRKFSDVLESLLNLETEKEFRVRISSIEPDQIDDRFFDLMRHPRMTRHLHLCVQAASERVLLAMRRQYTYAQYREIVARLRELDPSFNITTDIIIGFPGETDEDFSASLGSVSEIGFGHVHVFPYSRRQGTRADRMAAHVGQATKASRAAELAEASDAAKRRYRQSLVGTVQEVLVETVATVDHKNGGVRVDFGGAPTSTGTQFLEARGLGEYYVPVRFEIGGDRSPASLRNHFFRVRIVALAEGPDPDLIGQILF